MSCEGRRALQLVSDCRRGSRVSQKLISSLGDDLKSRRVALAGARAPALSESESESQNCERRERDKPVPGCPASSLRGSHLSPASDTGPGRCRQYLDTRRLDTISNTHRFFSAPLRVLDVKCIVYEWLPGCQARCPDYQLRARGDGRAGRAEPRKQTQPGIGDTRA